MTINWMCRASGTAALPPPRNSSSTGRSNSRISAVTTAVIAVLSPIPAQVIRLTRWCCPAPMFCATIAVIAAPIAIAGIWI